jgi:flagellar motor switch protein FliG
MNDRAVMIAMRSFSNRELARIILFMPEMAEVFYRNMSAICADMIRENISEVDVIDNYSVMSGKDLYKHFIEKMKHEEE